MVTQLADGSLTLNLQSLGGLPASVFDFSGTGTAPGSDADRAAYQVDTGTLTQTSVASNSPAQVLGFVTGFGMAPPDFTAETLITAPAIEAELQVRFGRSGSQTAFIGLSVQPVTRPESRRAHDQWRLECRGDGGSTAPVAHDQGGGSDGGGGKQRERR